MLLFLFVVTCSDDVNGGGRHSCETVLLESDSAVSADCVSLIRDTVYSEAQEVESIRSFHD